MIEEFKHEFHNQNIIVKLGEPLYLASFCIGLAVLTFSIVLIWHNELRIVKFASFVSEAKKELRIVDVDFPREKDDYWLVHAKGQTQN